MPICCFQVRRKVPTGKIPHLEGSTLFKVPTAARGLSLHPPPPPASSPPPPPALRPTGHNIDTEQLIYVLNSTWRISFWLNVSVTLRNTCSCCFHSEYIKVIDGNGTTVISRYGSSSTTQKTFREVSFGNSGNITVELYLRRSYSNFKLQFEILKQGFQSGKPRTRFNRR